MLQQSEVSRDNFFFRISTLHNSWAKDKDAIGTFSHLLALLCAFQEASLQPSCLYGHQLAKLSQGNTRVVMSRSSSCNNLFSHFTEGTQVIFEHFELS